MRRTYLPAILLTTIGVVLLLGLSFYGAIPTVYAQITGTNWIGQFYNNTTLSDAPVNTGLFPAGLNTNWGVNPPTDGFGAAIAGVNADNWSARFTSTESIEAGLYEFVLVADDGARLYIDGNLVIDNFDSTGLTQASVVLSLSGGVYTIIVDYRDVTDAAVLQLSWFLTQPTPEFTATPLPLAEAQVDSVRVSGLALRTGPYLGASLINVLRPDRVYPITAQNFSEGIYTWYRITVPSTGQVGWASGRYLNITGTAAITGTCPITAEFALSVVQRLLPAYTDATQANSCITALNNGEFISAATNQCAPIINNAASNGTFFDVVDLSNELTAACNFNNPTIRYNLPTVDSVFDVINNRPDVGVTGVTRSVMNFRVRPSQRSAQIGDLPQIGWGEVVNIIGRTVQEGDDFWYQVRYGDRVGWILADFVRIRSGNIGVVPIY